MPTVEELEKEKLRLEIKTLKKGKGFPWETLFGALQVIAVIIGVFLTVSEFKSKTQDKTLEKAKISLEYVSKISDREISASRDSLQLYQSRLTVALSNPEFDRLFERTSADFEKNTAPLANYYSVLQSGIEKGYFDRELCTAFLDHIVTRDIQSLYEIQTHHGGMRNNRSRPDYRQFKGMITFYVSGHDTVDYYDRQVIPHYDIDKPFIYQRGRSSLPQKPGYW